MSFEVEEMRREPGERGGVPCWDFVANGAEARFLGRGSPAREASWPSALLPREVERAWLRQVHSDRVLEAVPGLCGEADALVVRRPGLAATVATADCVPILLAGPRAAAAVHAGWRGLSAHVIAAALERLGEAPRTMAWIGPAIGVCCYEVGPEVEAAVVSASSPEAVRSGPAGRAHLDLAAAAAEQLRRAGVERVVRIPVCTRCRPDLLWSHRGEGPGAGRNLALIWRQAGSE